MTFRSVGSPIGPETIVQASPGVTATSLGDGMALLDMKSSTYYQLNGLGAFVWNGLANPMSLGDMVALVREAFDVGDADVDGDVLAMINDLAANELLVLKNPEGA